MTIAELYSVCVGEGGMAPEYFMHALTFWEASLFVQGVVRRYRPQWETARYTAFYAVRPHLKDFGFEDMGKLPWEKEDDEPVSKEQELEELEATLERIRIRDKQLKT